MESPVRIYMGKATRLGASTSVQEAITRINSLIDAGEPLFTKKELHAVWQQLRNVQSKDGVQKISLKGLDGVAVEFAIETGDTHRSPLPGYEFIVQKPCIEYVPMQDLISSLWNRKPDVAYCNLRIYHYRVLRNISTKQLCGTEPVMSEKETEIFFQTHLQAWKASESCEKLRAILLSKGCIIDIRKVVGFALGSIASNDGSDLSTRLSTVSAFQHSLILTLRDILCEKQGKSREIPCYVQDPIYTDTDKSILESSGINILDDPEAFLQVDDATIVVSCAPNVPVKQIVSDLARPAVMIWDRIREREEEPLCTDPDSSRLRNLIRNHYEEIEFPGDGKSFRDLVVYIYRSDISSTGR